MMKNLKTISRLVALALLPMALQAQQASITVVGLSGQNLTVTGSAFYMPAGSYLNATGNIYLATDKIVTGSAGSTVTGAMGGRLHLLAANQLDATAPATLTQVDGNGISFDVNITSYNPQNVALADQSFGAVTADGSAHASFLREFAFGTVHPFTGVAVSDNHVLTNGNRFIVGASGTITGADVSRYVVTNDNAGELRKLGLTNGQGFFFPVGRAEADYTPARLQVASGGLVDYYLNVRNFSESIPDENIGGYAMAPNVSRTWMVYGSNAATVANMDFIHPGTPMYEANGYNRNSSNVIRFNGNAWVPNLPNDAENESLFGTPVNYWAQQITFGVPSAIGSNSFYGKSNSLVVLPVRLGNFTVAAPRCEAQLNWMTLSEQNLSHFNIERSYDGRPNTWQVVAKVIATGNSSVPRQYTSADGKAIAAEAFYRLAIVENDGRVSYSPIRIASFNCATKITGFPNPAQETFTVLLPQGSTTYSVRLLNAAGQQVLPVITKASGNLSLSTGKLAAGIYTVVVTDISGKTTTIRMLKL